MSCTLQGVYEQNTMATSCHLHTFQYVEKRATGCSRTCAKPLAARNRTPRTAQESGTTAPLKELETQCCTFTDFLETAPAVNDVMPNLLYYSISSDANEIRCCQSFDRKQPLVNQSRIN